ncbi:zinc-binding alcohol dehydrogenase family protein [Jiulongibacter sp. NS-SX5]|uniref:zinc-binding alcohol dehydrogenase family protein n=1 Tax=Jiulongibacter sp. NS-SX5 TaxID=3463854 RepID=UPI0040585935
MKSFILNSPTHFKKIESNIPTITKADEVLVKVKTIGICGTDIHAFHGRQPYFTYPRILGHELGVEIVEIGDQVQNLKVGDRCSVEPYLNCGECHPCLKGHINCCEKLEVLGVHIDGGMSEFLVLPSRKLHNSDLLSYRELAVVETYGIGCHAVSRAQVQKGDKVLVIGAGPIGITAIDFAQINGGEVHVFDLSSERLKFCEKYGKGNNFIHTEPKENEYDVVFDATGHLESMKQSIRYMAFGGRLIFIGLFQGDYTFNDPYFHKKETTILSSRNALPEDFKRIIRLIESGHLSLEPFITNELGFDDIPDFFPQIPSNKQLLKAVVNL